MWYFCTICYYIYEPSAIRDFTNRPTDGGHDQQEDQVLEMEVFCDNIVSQYTFCVL